MASGVGDVIKWGLVIGGAYLAWNWYQNYLATQAVVATPAPAPTPSSTTGAAASTTATAATTTTRRTQLLNLAGATSTTTLNADQWNYYYSQLGGSFPAGVFDSLFFPNGRPSDPTQVPTYSVDGFLNLLATKGLSGLGARVIAVPRMLRTPQGRMIGMIPARRFR